MFQNFFLKAQFRIVQFSEGVVDRCFIELVVSREFCRILWNRLLKEYFRATDSEIWISNCKYQHKNLHQD